VYSSEMPNGIILYMDLDIVMIQNFDTQIIAMSQSEKPMSCVSDAVSWMGERFSPSLMCFESGKHAHIFDRFQKLESVIVGREVATKCGLDHNYILSITSTRRFLI
jgi:hypothetical protein